jgi:TPR repeat protein
MLAEGLGVAENDAEVETWLLGAAERDVAEAQNNLGILYSRAEQRDDVKALMWFDLAAADRYPGASDRGDQLHTTMSPSDIAASQELADQWIATIDGLRPTPSVIMDVEDCARADSLAAVDPDRGFEACKRLAENGNPSAQLSVALNYIMGIGISPDEAEAYAWASIAAAQHPEGETGELAVRIVERIAEIITPADLEAGKRRAADWKRTAP